jgi:hypothetical protein
MGIGIAIITGTIVLITIGTSSITAISESTQACAAAAIDPGDAEVGGDIKIGGSWKQGPLSNFRQSIIKRSGQFRAATL